MFQHYILSVVAMDAGDTRLSSTARVTVHVVNERSRLPPQWQLVGGRNIDDLDDVRVSENSIVNSLVTRKTDSLRLVATSDQGEVRYFITNVGLPELNGDKAFKIPVTSSNPNDTVGMVIAVGKTLDASIVPSYVLRCRAFYVSICLTLLYKKQQNSTF